MVIRAIRGAIQLDSDDREHLLKLTAELLAKMLHANNLHTDQLVSILFTAACGNLCSASITFVEVASGGTQTTTSSTESDSLRARPAPKSIASFAVADEESSSETSTPSFFAMLVHTRWPDEKRAEH